MISFIFIILAAICNAFMDTSVHHYYSSIFTKLNPLWWNGEISWKNKYNNVLTGDGGRKKCKILFFNVNKPVQITDAFHFFKTLMIIFICLSVVTYNKYCMFIGCHLTWYNFLIMLSIYGVLWNVSFSLFYNKILRKKY